VTTSLDAHRFNEFKDMLRRGIVHFKYTKLDGTERVAHGTLDPSMWPASKDPKHPAPAGAKYTNYFDLQANDWRSFVNDNVFDYQWSGKTFIIARPHYWEDVLAENIVGG
jgi:hypothetical protein